MFFYVFFFNIIKFKYFCIVLLYYYIYFISFLHIRSLLVPYLYVSIESIDCILLSSFEFKAILLILSVKTLRLSLSNLCCIFNIDLSLFINSLHKKRSLSLRITADLVKFIEEILNGKIHFLCSHSLILSISILFFST